MGKNILLCLVLLEKTLECDLLSMLLLFSFLQNNEIYVLKLQVNTTFV